MTRTLAVAALAGLLALPARADEARVQLGVELARQVLPGERSGLSITVEEDRDGAVATVREQFSALGASPAYPFAGAADCPDRSALDADGFRELPAELMGAVRQARSTYDVLLEVVAFVSERIRLDENDTGPQDAHSVLDRGRGRCSGRANLTVGLLRVLGVPARVVHGVLADDAAARWHRWGEAWLGPDRWTPFDPGASVGFVRVRYLPVLTTPEVQSAVAARLVSTSEGGFGSLPRWRGLRVRPEAGATLHCFVPGMTPVAVRLIGPDGLPRVAMGAPEVVFDLLLPGRYTIRTGTSLGAGAPIGLTIGGAGDVRINLALPGRSGS